MPDPFEPDPTVATPTEQNASVARGTDETTPHAGSARPKFGPPVAPGEVGTLGPYRVVKELGAGGMGAVYLALDTRLQRRLALKVMLPAFAADRDAKERFLREARAAAQVSHDNVVTVYEADERNGVPYIAMQLLQGYPIDRYLKDKGAPPLPHVIRIAREVALGLAAAHELGLVHRDIKPSNLWLEAPNGRIKVLDFGLAKPIGTDAELTKSGAVVGTPAYMSPEQAKGEKVDHRTDLWSLGAVLYRLCTGKTPFAGPNVTAVLIALATEEPAPVRQLNPNVPEALAQLIHQLLAKRPDVRPQTASDVAKRLRTILDQLLAPARTASDAPAPPGSAEVSTSLPVVVHPLPVQPPIVVPMQITAQPDDVFAHLGDDTEATEADALPRIPREKSLGTVMILAAVAAVLLAVVAVVLMGKKSGPTVENEPPGGGPHPGDTSGKGPSTTGKGPPGKAGPPTERYSLGVAMRTGDVAFSPDGARLLTGGAQPAIRDAATGKSVIALPVEKGMRLAYSRDGKRVAVSSDESADVVVCASDTGQVIRRLGPFGRGGCWLVAFTPDGATVFVGYHNVLHRAAVDSGEVTEAFALPKTGEMRYAAVSPDGSLLAHPAVTTGSSGATESFVRVVRLADFKEVGRIHRPGDPPNSIRQAVWTRDGTGLVCSYHKGEVRWVEWPGGAERFSLQAHAGECWAATSTDGTVLFTVGADGWLRSWDVSTGRNRAEVWAARTLVWAVTADSTGRAVATMSVDGTVKVFDLPGPAVAPRKP